MTFTFNSAITAFGLDIIDLGTVDATTLTATYDGGSVVLVSNFESADAGNLLFRGFTSATPFLTVTLTNSAARDYVEFDNVVFGAAGAAVPEPATWAMMILGMGAAGVAMRRRRARARVVFA